MYIKFVMPGGASILRWLKTRENTQCLNKNANKHYWAEIFSHSSSKVMVNKVPNVSKAISNFQLFQQGK